jgi:SAM-dependent methyltransferase
MTEKTDEVKEFYQGYHDRIFAKRYNSPFWLRRYTHRQIHAQILAYVKPGQRVLDVGCGEGILSCLAAQKGATVIGTDISGDNIRGAKDLAKSWAVKVDFLQTDAESLPFNDDSIDLVISSHVLEHLPDLFGGLNELHRVTGGMALIAMPTCLNPSCWALLGGDNFWKLTRRSPIAVPFGLLRTLFALVRGDEGPDEGYGGNTDVPHIWRFPWVMRRQIESVGFNISKFESGPLTIPYLANYIPFLRRLQPMIDSLRGRPILRQLGYGSLAICNKNRS